MDIFFSQRKRPGFTPKKTDSKITALGPKSQRFMKKSERKQFPNVVVTTFPIRPVLRSEWKICKSSRLTKTIINSDS